MNKLIFIIFTTLLMSNPLYAKTLYVNNQAGNDNTSYSENDENRPWATIGRAVWGQTTRPSNYPAINTTSEAAQAGDIVLVNAGTYSTNQAVGNRGVPIFNPVNQGSQGNPITIKADGRVVLQSDTGGIGEPLIGSQGRQYITWDGFFLNEENINTASDTGPVVAFGSSFIIIINCEIVGVYNAWDDNHVGVRVENSFDISIINNKIYNFRYYASGKDSQNCTGIETYNTDRVLIANNEIFNCGSGMYIKQENQGLYTIQYNYIHDVGTNGLILQQVTSANIFQNLIRSSPNGIKIQSYAPNYGPSNLNILNNTIDDINGDQGALFIMSIQYSENITFKNNILSNSNTAISGPGVTTERVMSVMDIEHNHYYNNGMHAFIGNQNYSFSSWRSSFNQDSDQGIAPASEYSDPGYRDQSGGNLSLRDGANALNKGQDFLDLNFNGQTSETINRGAYVNSDDIIGLDESGGVGPGIIAPNPPSSLRIVTITPAHL